MRQTGIVRQTFTKHIPMARVEITRSSACGDNCASCGLCPGRSATVEAENRQGAITGDTVIIDMADKKVLGAAFLVYIVPLIALIAGYFAANAVFGSEALGIIFGFALMLLTFALLMLADKRIKHCYTPHITQIVCSEKRS